MMMMMKNQWILGIPNCSSKLFQVPKATCFALRSRAGWVSLKGSQGTSFLERHGMADVIAGVIYLGNNGN